MNNIDHTKLLSEDDSQEILDEDEFDEYWDDEKQRKPKGKKVKKFKASEAR